MPHPPEPGQRSHQLQDAFLTTYAVRASQFRSSLDGHKLDAASYFVALRSFRIAAPITCSPFTPLRRSAPAPAGNYFSHG